MEVHPQILIFAVSLVAILALAGFAHWMRLGGEPELGDAADVRRIASEVEDGFEAVVVGIDHAGAAALLKDANGRIMLITRHGNHFAGRVLGHKAQASHSGDALIVDSGERRFGCVPLIVDDWKAWEAAINRLGVPRNA